MVVAAGESPAAQALMGKTVALLGGAMYAQYPRIKADQCLLLPAGDDAGRRRRLLRQSAHRAGHGRDHAARGPHALVHTAAASNLGQMLNRICLKDGIALVNIVRKPEQAKMLKDIGAARLRLAVADFMDELTAALAATGATLAFDAIGGGKLAGQILTGMEAALNRSARNTAATARALTSRSIIYGGLDPAPTEFVAQLRHGLGHGRLAAVPVPAEDRRGARRGCASASSPS